MAYLRLIPEVYLIEGRKQSALVNVLTGEIIALDPDEADEIRRIENNEPCSITPTMDELIRNAWMSEVDAPIFVDKIRYSNAFNKKRFWKSFPQITTVIIQITSRCGNECGNQRCKRSFCPVSMTSDRPDEMSLESFQRIMGLMERFHPLLIIMCGGNPFSHPDFEEMYRIAGTVANKVYVSLCSTRHLDRSHKDIPKVLTVSKGDDPRKVSQLAKNDPNLDVFVDSVSVPRQSSFKRFRDPPLVEKRDLESRVSIGEFFTRRSYDGCLCGKITILSNGDVVPCFGLRESRLGNCMSDDFETILRALYDGFWSICVDDWSNCCTSCPYRYNCRSCRKYGSSNCGYDQEVAAWR